MAPRRPIPNAATGVRQRSISDFFSSSPIASRVRRQGPLPTIRRSQNSQQSRNPTHGLSRPPRISTRSRARPRKPHRSSPTVPSTRDGRLRALRILENEASMDSFPSPSKSLSTKSSSGKQLSSKSSSRKPSHSKSLSARTLSFSPGTERMGARTDPDSGFSQRRETSRQTKATRSEKLRTGKALRPASNPPVGQGLRLRDQAAQPVEVDVSRGSVSSAGRPQRVPAPTPSKLLSKVQSRAQTGSLAIPQQRDSSDTHKRAMPHALDSSETRKRVLRPRSRTNSSESSICRSFPVVPSVTKSRDASQEPQSFDCEKADNSAAVHAKRPTSSLDSRTSKELSPDELQVHDQLKSLECSLDSTSTRKRIVGVKPIPRRAFAFASQSSNPPVPVRQLRNRPPVPAAKLSAPSPSLKPFQRECGTSRQGSPNFPRSSSRDGSSRIPNMSREHSSERDAATPTKQTDENELGQPKTLKEVEKPKQAIMPGTPSESAVGSGSKLHRDSALGSENISTPPRSCGANSSSSNSSSDSELSFNEHDANVQWRNDCRNANVRRSSRTTKAIDRFTPGEPSVPVSSLRGKDVFEDSFLTRSQLIRGRNDPDRELKRIALDAKRMTQQQDAMKEMRQNLEADTNKIEKDEMEFGSAARTEQELDAQYSAAMERYSLPLEIFRNEVDMRRMPRKYLEKSRMKRMTSPLVDLYVLLKGRGAMADIAVSMIGSAALDWCALRKPVTFYCVNQLYHLCIFDDSLPSPGKCSREELTDALIHMASRRQGDVRYVNGLPPLIDALEHYGAVLDEENDDQGRKLKRQRQNASTTTLDSIAGVHARKRTDAQDEKFKICVRNINRAFRLAAAQLDNEWAFDDVVGDMDRNSNQLTQIVSTVGLCAKVMLSKFGSHVKRSAGEVVHAAVGRAQESEWVSLRLDIAKHVLSITSRLNLHVEMVVHMLPFWSERALQCSFDIAFLSLYQWCEGPGNHPHGRAVDSVIVSERAQLFGLEKMSFCIGDVIEVMEGIPELTNVTDDEWACGLARLLKQLLTMPEVLRRRKEDEIGILNQRLQKLRRCSHRMKGNLGVQEMRLALDALLRCIECMCSVTKEDRFAIRPNVQGELKQSTLKQSTLEQSTSLTT